MARRTTQITLSDSADITTVDNNFQTIEDYLVCDYVESDLATLKTNHPASTSEINKKCKINSDNTIYKCKLVGGNYSWEKDYENGIIYATYAELKTLKNAKGLVAGQKYRITDYVTTVNSSLTEYKSAGHQFDLIIEALDSETFSEDAKAIQHEGDTYFANCKLESWVINYIFDNSEALIRFDWADTTNGKGLIYRMIDENFNDYPYDFKNAMRKVYKVTANTKQTDYVGKYFAIKSMEVTTATGNNTIISGNNTINESDYKWCYTFTKCDSHSTMSTIEDYSLGWTQKKCCNNVNIQSYGDSTNVALKSVFNVFLNISGTCWFNGFTDGNSGGNIFGDGCTHNKAIGSMFMNNSFGNNCNSNSFGVYCHTNSFGNNCDSNSLGNNCAINSFGNNCTNNSISNNCNANSFGNSCSNNSLGNHCINNSINASKNQNELSCGCNKITLNASNVKVIKVKSSVTYSTNDQIVTS